MPHCGRVVWSSPSNTPVANHLAAPINFPEKRNGIRTCQLQKKVLQLLSRTQGGLGKSGYYMLLLHPPWLKETCIICNWLCQTWLAILPHSASRMSCSSRNILMRDCKIMGQLLGSLFKDMERAYRKRAAECHRDKRGARKSASLPWRKPTIGSWFANTGTEYLQRHGHGEDHMRC